MRFEQPTPLRLVIDKDATFPFRVVDADGKFVIEPYATPDEIPDLLRCMAAGPDLLAALEDVRDWINDQKLDPGATRSAKIDRAIEKAVGIL